MKGKRRKIRILSLVIIFALLALITVGCASGAPPKEAWNQTFGGTDSDWAHSVQQTFDGGYILAGHTKSYGAGEYDFWLVKTDSDGNEQWNKTFGGTESDSAYSVQQTSDGGYILAGYTGSYGADLFDFWLVKTDPDGNEQWNKTFDCNDDDRWDTAKSVQQTADGGYILAGTTAREISVDFWLVKADPDGNKQWDKTFDGTDLDWAHSVQQTSDGGYILAGGTYGADESDFWLVKADSDGNEQWNKTFGGWGFDSAYSVQQTLDGGYILAGNTRSSQDADLSKFWLVKTDSNGNEQWNKTLGGNYFNEAQSVKQTADGGYILAGITGSRGSSVDFWLVKIDPDGNKQWDKILGGTGLSGYSEYYGSVQQTADEGYILAGSTNSSGAGRSDFWLIKIEREVQTPTAFFTHIPRYPGVNETIIFDASFSYDSDGNITNYEWDFGDGNIINTAEKMITHSYALEGDYNVNLTVIDNDGLVNSTSKAVKVLMSPLLEEWNRTFGGAYDDRAWSVQQTSDGGYILTGKWSYDADLYDFWLVKADSDGNKQWDKTFGGTGHFGDNTGYYGSVRQTKDGGYILAASTYLYGAGCYYFWLVKADSDGNEQWNKTFDGNDGNSWNIAKSVQQTSDGGYILAGDKVSHEAWDFWLVKTDPDGNEQWNKTFGGWGIDYAHSVQQTSDGGYILAGAWSYGYDLYDFWLVKTDPDGNEQWNKTFGGRGFDYAYSVQQTSDGGYILAGYTNSYGAGGNDFWLVKTDSNGNEQWNRTIGGANDDRAYSVWQTTDRGYILAGYTRSYGASKGDFWLVKTDPDGNKQWDKTFGGTDRDWAHSVQQTSDGGYILAGYTNSYGVGEGDFWLIKVGRDPIESASGITIPEVPTEEDKGMPGFELIFGIAGLLAVIYLFNRKNQR